ncbi:hypothetical protein V8E36_004401 [Tilletia maclaganii]
MSRNLTHQLAETAVGVREVSKQLGRARVQLDSSVRSVLIITKARDNHLIRLTRELALWLMLNKRPGKDRGLVVYVDSQLRGSKRFDAQGIRAEYPHLFEPSSEPAHPRKCMLMEDRRAELQQQRTPPPSADNIDMVREQRGEGEKDGASKVTGERPEELVEPEDNDEEGQLRYWTSEMCSRFPQLFDLVVTLGGDGTVLFASWLFQRIVPPILPFSLGSLGFLTNFDFNRYEDVLKSALERGIRVNLRMRFTATVYRAELPTTPSQSRCRRRAIRNGKTGEIMLREIKEAGWDAIEGQDASGSSDRDGGPAEPDEDEIAAKVKRRHRLQCLDTDTNDSTRRHKGSKKDKEVMCFTTRPAETFEILNDLVVDRGPSPYVSLLEVFGDEHHMTTVQADGLCISTPTGSTAYSLSAGGSLAHPEIPAILLTPICPHTLSFRPMLLPDSMELRIAVPYSSRSAAWASFDGRGRVELRQGDHIKVTASRYPFPTVCAEDQSIDWFRSVSRTLKWNERQKQKSFVVFEDNDGVSGGGASGSNSGGSGGGGGGAPGGEASGGGGGGGKPKKNRSGSTAGGEDGSSSGARRGSDPASAEGSRRRSKSSASASGQQQQAQSQQEQQQQEQAKEEPPRRRASRQLKDRSLPNGHGPLSCDCDEVKAKAMNDAEEADCKPPKRAGHCSVPNVRVSQSHSGDEEEEDAGIASDATYARSPRKRDRAFGGASDDDNDDEDDDDESEDEDEDEDEEEDEHEEEFDITDSSAHVTRSNSPSSRNNRHSSSYSSSLNGSCEGTTAGGSTSRRERERQPSNPASLSDLASDLRRRSGGLSAAVNVGNGVGAATGSSSNSSSSSSTSGAGGGTSAGGGSILWEGSMSPNTLSAIGGPSLNALRKLSPILRDTAAAGVRAAAVAAAANQRPGGGNLGPSGVPMQHHPGMVRRLTGADADADAVAMESNGAEAAGNRPGGGAGVTPGSLMGGGRRPSQTPGSTESAAGSRGQAAGGSDQKVSSLGAGGGARRTSAGGTGTQTAARSGNATPGEGASGGGSSTTGSAGSSSSSGGGGGPAIGSESAAAARARGKRQGAALVVYGDDSSDSDSAGEE